MGKYLLFIFAVIASFTAVSQDFSNKGKDFWVGYGSHVSMYTAAGAMNTTTGGSQNMVLYFTSDDTANVTVTIPATGWIRNYTIIPPPFGTGLVETQVLPKTGIDDARLGQEQKYIKKGIHVTSDKPIVAYAHNYNGSISGATLLFPTNTLGKEYFALNYKQNSNQQWSYPYVFVIASEDSTIIQTTPSANTLTRLAGVTYTDTLMQGDILNLLGQLLTNTNNSSTGVDLTGTRIKSLPTATGQCKKIAVFSGSGKIGIACPVNTGVTADNYIQQCFPATAWGKKYYTVPTAQMLFNYFRVMVNDPATVVMLNGVVQGGLISNRYYDLPLSNTPNIIEADQPIMVAQFITTTGQCGNANASNGDPEMIYLSSIEQTIDKVTLNSTPWAAISSARHFINVIIKATGVPTFRLDGVARTFIPHPQDPTYVYGQFNVPVGVHRMLSDSGFSAIAYGYGNVESYGYNAGTNIKDLYQQIGVSSQYGIVTTPTVCTSSPFKFKVALPYIPDSMYWDFSGAVGMAPNNNNVFVDNTGNITEDSTTVINGKIIHWYSLPTFYSFSTAGTYPIEITTYVPNADCGSEQLITF